METNDATVIPYHKSNRGRTANVPKSVPKQARKQAGGRKAFQTDECEIHGKADDGAPCAKFSHLRTDGLGQFKPPFYRAFLATFTKALRPLFIVLLIIGLLYIATHFVGRALHIGNGISGPAKRAMSGSVRPSPNHSLHYRGISPTDIAIGNDSDNAL